MNIVTDLEKEKQVIKIANNAIHGFNWLFRGVKCMNVRKLDIC